jgi:hypothetical protein
MITVLSLVVAILAVFIGPLVAWAVARQQIAVAARETWMREFRENVAAFLTGYAAFREHIRSHTPGDPEKERRLAEINDVTNPSYHVIRFLIAEKDPQYTAFIQTLDALNNAPCAPSDKAADRQRELIAAAEGILRCERAAIATDPGVLSTLWATVGFGGGRFPPALPFRRTRQPRAHALVKVTDHAKEQRTPRGAPPPSAIE